MSGGLAGTNVGYGDVYSDERDGMRLDRKGYPRACVITDVGELEIEEERHGSATGEHGWKFNHDLWAHIRDVMPALSMFIEAVKAEGQEGEGEDLVDGADDPDDGEKDDGGPARRWRPMWDAEAVDLDLKRRALGDVRVAGGDDLVLATIPDGWPGQVVRGSDHNEQRPLYYGAGYPIVADTYGGEVGSSYRYAAHGTSIDFELRAREDTAAHVKYRPTGGPAAALTPGIAQNIGPDGGLFVSDRFERVTKSPPENVYRESPTEDDVDRSLGEITPPPLDPVECDIHQLGYWSHKLGGGISTGPPTDQHYLGSNALGEPAFPAHYSIQSIRNLPDSSPVYDSPMDHDLRFWEAAGLSGFWYEVQARWDPDSSHSIPGGGGKRGLWRRETKIPLAPPTYRPPYTPPPGQPPDTPPDTPVDPPIDTIPIPDDFTLPGVGGGPDALGFIRSETLEDPANPSTLERFWAHALRERLPGPVTWSYMQMGVPSLLIQPEPQFGVDVLRPGEDEAGDAIRATERPFVGHLLGFGHRTGDGYAFETTTQRGEVYLAHPTGPGGTLYAPPEYSLHRTGSYPTSTTYWAYHPDVITGWGTPTSDGLLGSGNLWTHAGSGVMALQAYDSAGAAIAGGAAGDIDYTIHGDLTVSGGTVTTGIAPTQVVYSAAGVLSGDAGLTWLNGTDTLTIGTGAGTAGNLVIKGYAGVTPTFNWKNGTGNRWGFHFVGSAESGSDVGSELRLNSYTDAGGLKDTLLEFQRPGLVWLKSADSAAYGLAFGSATAPTIHRSNSAELTFTGDAIFTQDVDVTRGLGVGVAAPTTAGYAHVNDRLGVGVAPASPVHIYENTALAGTTAGVTIEQDGTGDAILQYLLTGAARWVTGLDNSDGDKFKIAASADLNTDAIMTLSPTGQVGIGTVNPSNRLHVYRAAASTGVRVEVDNNFDPEFEFYEAGARVGSFKVDTSANKMFFVHDQNTSSARMQFRMRSATDVLVLTGDYKVGVGGVLSPTQTLEVIDGGTFGYGDAYFSRTGAAELTLTSDLIVGQDLDVTRGLGVGVAAPTNAGDIQYTSQILAPNGTAAAPAYAFSDAGGDFDSGFFRAAVDAIGVSIATDEIHRTTGYGLDLKAGLSYGARTVVTLAEDGFAWSGHLRVEVNAETGTTDNFEIIETDNVQDGQVVIIEIASGDTITVIDARTGSGTGAANMRLAGIADWAMTAPDNLTLMWNATDSYWDEISRTNL